MGTNDARRDNIIQIFKLHNSQYVSFDNQYNAESALNRLFTLHKRSPFKFSLLPKGSVVATVYRSEGTVAAMQADHTSPPSSIRRPHHQPVPAAHQLALDSFSRTSPPSSGRLPSAWLAPGAAARSQGLASEKQHDLHDLVKNNRITQIIEHLRTDPDTLHVSDSDGDTPLHIAAQESSPMTVQLLLDRGASVYANNHKGLNPHHAAAALKYGHVAMLIAQHARDRAHVMHEPFWYSVQDIERRLHVWAGAQEQKPRHYGHDAISDAVETLTGAYAEKEFNRGKEVIKYATHLASIKGMIDGVDATGWNAESFLLQRIRTLLTILLNQVSATGDTHRKLTAEHRQVFLQELACELESLRLTRRINSFSGEPAPVVAMLAHVEATNIVARACEQPMHHEINIPLGFEGHALYVALRTTLASYRASADAPARVVPSIQIRIDNLGDGSRSNHVEDVRGKRMSRTITLPRALVCEPEVQALMAEFIRDIITCEATEKSTGEQFYCAVARFIQSIQQAHPGIIADEEHLALDTDARSLQWSGNCVLKNHTPGVRVRLGDKALYRWFNSYEEQCAESLIKEYADPVRLIHRAKERKARDKLDKMLKKQEHDLADRLRVFLDKSKHASLVHAIPMEQVQALIKAGDCASLNELLLHRFNPNSRDSSNQCPLFWAIDADQIDVVHLLLRNGAIVDATDDRGETPLFHAIRRGDPTMISVLINAGADPGHANADGITPQQLLDTWRSTCHSIESLLQSAPPPEHTSRRHPRADRHRAHESDDESESARPRHDRHVMKRPRLGPHRVRTSSARVPPPAFTATPEL